MKINFMTKIFLLILFLLMIFTINISAKENDFINEFSKDEFINSKLGELQLNDLDKVLKDIKTKNDNPFININARDLILSLIKGEQEISLKDFKNSIFLILGREISINIHLLGQIIILAVLSSVIKIFSENFSSKTISEGVEILIFFVLSLILLESFQTAIKIAVNTVDQIVTFMQAILPILLALLISMGGFVSAAFFKPFTYLLLSFYSTTIKNLVLPLIFISSILYIADNINNKINISNFAKFFREIAYIIIALILITTIGIFVIRGGTTAIADSLSLRTAKYLTGTFIPVVGGFFADAADLILSCSLIIKNSLNIFAVIIVIFISLYPILKIAVLIIIYKIAIIIIQPIAANRLINIMEAIKNNLISIFVVILTTSFIFFICIAIIAGTANLTVMMR
ncbi:MAG: stage III sporulation protein AE [Bacillota bacterium]